MSQAWADQLDLLIRARTPILWIRSGEEERTITSMGSTPCRPRPPASWC